MSHVACTGAVGTTNRVLTSKRSQVGDTGIDEGRVLQWMFKKQYMNVWTVLMRHIIWISCVFL